MVKRIDVKQIMFHGEMVMDHNCKVSYWSLQHFPRYNFLIFPIKTMWLPPHLIDDVIIIKIYAPWALDYIDNV